MIKRIFKYTIEPSDKIEIEMPTGAEVLTAQEQQGKPQLWALVSPDAPKETRVFRMVGTGHPIQDEIGIDCKYITTFQLMGGQLVFHLFEQIGG